MSYSKQITKYAIMRELLDNHECDLDLNYVLSYHVEKTRNYYSLYNRTTGREQNFNKWVHVYHELHERGIIK